jgi:hypothetical protein
MLKKQYDYQHTTQEYVDFVTKKKGLQNRETGDILDIRRKRTKSEIIESFVSYTAIIFTLLVVIAPLLLVAAAVIVASFKFPK